MNQVFIQFGKHCLLIFVSFVISVCCLSQQSIAQQYSYQHPINYQPSKYVCYSTDKEVIIDGKIEEDAWSKILWTADFIDIEGSLKPEPKLKTKVKMTWDQGYFYFAAIMEEPHIWATLTERDAIMYHDDDFEIFIDPDSDGHNYFEFEMNAFNAIWDLYMLYPYNIDQGRNYIMNWDIRGVKTAVHVEGTINDPSDIDRYWSVEVAVPWDCFKDFKRDAGRPVEGEQWRINFSRVDWKMDVVNRKYAKRIDEQTGKRYPENNWVWSPTGYINMHKPEVWGYVQFEKNPEVQFVEVNDERIKWALWQMYYQLKECRNENGASCELKNLSIPHIQLEGYNFLPQIIQDQFGFNITASLIEGGSILINEKGKMVTR